ncbi:MAG: hypothetical protein A3K19_16750 [Lentisphaerae bacterium RIFOXYB12_FULL_65_16]|nr:MAG: hypothetical protein A3K18_26660 [Lentisphaerae bacterium RIFOXYA12_64_32]OGV88970.1 MAG: hypothetical protein A3K19_16750 [Lentisphaerae bacterium RIFOXYB12_FULL_65_16]
MSVRAKVGLIALLLCCGLLRCVAAEGEPPRRPETPADLQLTPEEAARSDALSNFAWGVYRQLEGPQEAAAFLKYYEEALRLAPDSDLALEHLVAPLMVERKFDEIVRILTPIADANPSCISIQILLAEALGAQDKPAEARSRLERLMRGQKTWEPALFRELYVAYWREKRDDDVMALLRRTRRRFGDHFVIEHAAALFFNALAQREAKAGGAARKQVGLERQTLAYARRAVVLAADADREEDVESLAALLHDREQWQDLVDLLQAVGTMGELYTPEMALMLATGLDQLGRRAEAMQVLQGVAQPEVMRPDLFPEIARLYATFDQLEMAASFFESSMSAFPRSLPIKLRLGYVLLRLNRAERVLEILPDADEAESRKMPPEVHYLRSHALKELGRLEEAARALGKAEAAALAVGDKNFLSVHFHLYYAALCEDLGYTDRALERARKALELDPTSTDAANFLGYVLADHSRDLPEAEKWIRMAVQADPENFAFLDSLAWVYYRQGQYAPALVEINKALRLSGAEPDPVILDHAGDIHAANGFTLLAEQYWRRALGSGAKATDKVRILEKLRQLSLPAGATASPVAGGEREPLLLPRTGPAS